MSSLYLLIALLLIDALFIAILFLFLIPLSMVKKAAYAVLKRNFVGYFSNPTGYVFLCLFVMLSSISAFWPHEFFAANLANLDQLNAYLPFIMLIFIPAITMSIWADEKRQGTDELLLTLPAADFEIVLGKYLAAASIFTASLLFSQLSNFLVLLSLTRGNLDLGLFCSTYIGYWLMGLAMLAIGMIASFLTSNLTVGFILGALFNAPLAFASSADVIVRWSDLARVVSTWSLGAQFDNFGRGVISSASIAYFVMLIVFGLFVSLALIGSRHWVGGKRGTPMLLHYVVRTLALVGIAAGLCYTLTHHDLLRVDTTENRISTLSADTIKLLDNLETQRPIVVDAFVSGDVPEEYFETRTNLITMLKEFKARASEKLIVNIYDNLEPYSEEATRAEEQYGILPATLRSESRGRVQDKEVILGAAFSCGLEKVVVPFFDFGIPVEYELIRSINTVAQSQRKRLGIIRSEAQLFGGIALAPQGPVQLPKHPLVAELEKQYEVEEVDAVREIAADQYDALMVVQPSSMPQGSMPNLVAAIETGVPTLIFEDPLPGFSGGIVPGTGQEKQLPNLMGGQGGGQTQPKADVSLLWRTLGINIDPNKRVPAQYPRYQPDLVWDGYNPYPKLQLEGIPDEFVFIPAESADGETLINSADPVTSGLSELLFPYPGFVEQDAGSELGFEKLVLTGKNSGTITFEEYVKYQRDPDALRFARKVKGDRVLAARIQSPWARQKRAGESAGAQTGTETRKIDVVYVADMDLMHEDFLRIRARPDQAIGIRWKFDNVTFLLNLVDSLTGVVDYMEIRKRKIRHSTLTVIEQYSQLALNDEYMERAKYKREYDEEYKKAERENQEITDELRKEVDKISEKVRQGEASQAELRVAVQRAAEQNALLNQRLATRKEQLDRKRDAEVKRIQRGTQQTIDRIQNQYKFGALFIPPIPPLMIALIVFVRRRLREREGISKARLL